MTHIVWTILYGSKLSLRRFMYTIGAFLAPLIMAPFITLANQNISTGKHPILMKHFWNRFLS